MIDRGAHERQAERDVHPAPEARVLEHRQTLIVIHREHAVGGRQPLGDEQRIGRERAARVDPGAHRVADRRRDDLGLLPAEIARLARMRVQPRHQDAGARDAEAPPQVGIQYAQNLLQLFPGNVPGDIGERQVRGGERYAQAAADQHHDHLLRTRALREKFGMAAKRDAGIVERAFLHRRGHHRVELAGEAAAQRALEDRDDIGAVRGVEAAGNARPDQRDVLDIGTAGKQAAVADRHDARGERLARHARAKLRPDPGRFARSERDDRSTFPQVSARRSSGRAAGATIPGRPRRICVRAAPGAPAGAAAPG